MWNRPCNDSQWGRNEIFLREDLFDKIFWNYNFFSQIYKYNPKILGSNVSPVLPSSALTDDSNSYYFCIHRYPHQKKKNWIFSQISQQQKKSTEACTTAFSIARPLGAKYGLKWVNILLYITIYMLYDLKLPLNYWSFSYDLNDPKKTSCESVFFKVLIFFQTLLYTRISTNINFSISKNIFYQIDLWPLSIHQKLLTSRLWS